MELTINLTILFTSILLIVTLFHDFSSHLKLNVLKTITGCLLIILGIALFIFLLNVPKNSRSSIYYWGFLLSIWTVLTGIFDLSKISRNTISDL